MSGPEFGAALGDALQATYGAIQQAQARKFQERQLEQAMRIAQLKSDIDLQTAHVRADATRYGADKRFEGVQATNDTNLKRTNLTNEAAGARTAATNDTNLSRTWLQTLSNQLIAQGHDKTAVQNAITAANSRRDAATIGANAQRDVSGNNLTGSLMRTLGTDYDSLYRPKNNSMTQLMNAIGAGDGGAVSSGSGDPQVPSFDDFVNQHLPGILGHTGAPNAGAALGLRPARAAAPPSTTAARQPAPLGPLGAPPSRSASPDGDDNDPSDGYVNPAIAAARAEMAPDTADAADGAPAAARTSVLPRPRSGTSRGGPTLPGVRNPVEAAKIGGDAVRSLSSIGLRPIASHGQSQPAATMRSSPSAASGAAPRIGDVKKFPNGRTGRWDGHGWLAADQLQD